MARRVRISSAAALLATLSLSACAPNPGPSPDAAALAAASAPPAEVAEYIIGPGDTLSIFVFRAPELSVGVPVRPDGRISVPLIADVDAAGRTPIQLARQIEERLKEYIRDPNVTVTVTSFVGLASRQIRIIGEAAQPRSIPFRDGMTVLDVLIQAGGLTRYASGNRAQIVRRSRPEDPPQVIRLRLADLLSNGDITQDVPVQPGDTLIIPQGWF